MTSRSHKITPHTLADLLARVPTADVEAIRLYLEIVRQEQGDGLDTAYLIENRRAIEAAGRQLATQIVEAHGLVTKCQRLESKPTKNVPAGI